MKKILKLRDVHKTFYSPAPIHVLNGVSLEIEEGETIAIMGKSGGGKSTLLNIIGTLENATQGFIELCGKIVEPASTSILRNQHIGFIFQSFHLLDDYTTLENVLMPAKIARQPTGPQSVAQTRALHLLEKVGLLPRAHFLTKLLSGGEKQRAAIARALCNNPDLILADEPSGNLDQANSTIIHELLLQCAKQYHKSLIVVTHDRELAGLCDRILLLKDGALQCIS